MLDDPAVVHEHESVADLAANCISCVTTSIVIPSQRVAHHDQHLADELRVERGGDLVEEHHVRLHHQRTGDRDPLLLAAGELMRMLPRLLGEADAGEQFACALLRLGAGTMADPACCERQVVHHGQVREEVELLENHPDPLAYGRDICSLAGDLLALEKDPTGIQRLEQVDATQECALPAPARADDRQHFAGRDLEVDPLEDVVVTEALVDALSRTTGSVVAAVPGCSARVPVTTCSQAYRRLEPGSS